MDTTRAPDKGINCPRAAFTFLDLRTVDEQKNRLPFSIPVVHGQFSLPDCQNSAEKALFFNRLSRRLLPASAWPIPFKQAAAVPFYLSYFLSS
jgi:hypothetical protein